MRFFVRRPSLPLSRTYLFPLFSTHARTWVVSPSSLSLFLSLSLSLSLYPQCLLPPSLSTFSLYPNNGEPSPMARLAPPHPPRRGGDRAPVRIGDEYLEALARGFKNLRVLTLTSCDGFSTIVCDFDWELDDLEDFTNDLIKDEALSEDQKDAFKDYVKEQVRETKKTQKQAREARRKAIEDMDPETKAAFENMRFYKFYPVQTPDTPDISSVKVPYINRYYGKAHVVM